MWSVAWARWCVRWRPVGAWALSIRSRRKRPRSRPHGGAGRGSGCQPRPGPAGQPVAGAAQGVGYRPDIHAGGRTPSDTRGVAGAGRRRRCPPPRCGRDAQRRPAPGSRADWIRRDAGALVLETMDCACRTEMTSVSPVYPVFPVYPVIRVTNVRDWEDCEDCGDRVDWVDYEVRASTVSTNALRAARAGEGVSLNAFHAARVWSRRLGSTSNRSPGSVHGTTSTSNAS